jgi:hypothetical protein
VVRRDDERKRTTGAAAKSLSRKQSTRGGVIYLSAGWSVDAVCEPGHQILLEFGGVLTDVVPQSEKFAELGTVEFGAETLRQLRDTMQMPVEGL